MPPWFSLAISALALAVSGATAWLTFFRRGCLKVTQPTVIFFGSDGLNQNGKPKIYLRTLLYSTSKRGQVVESLHVSLQRGETKQNFSVWVYGEQGNLKRGSGIFVPQEGVTFDHHFLQPSDGTNFAFLSGTYRVTVFAKLVGDSTPKTLTTISLSLTENLATALAKPKGGVFFDWGPDLQDYHSHLGTRPGDEENSTARLIESLVQMGRNS